MNSVMAFLTHLIESAERAETLTAVVFAVVLVVGVVGILWYGVGLIEAQDRAEALRTVEERILRARGVGVGVGTGADTDGYDGYPWGGGVHVYRRGMTDTEYKARRAELEKMEKAAMVRRGHQPLW